MIDLTKEEFEKFNEIPSFINFKEILKISKGWSNDIKYEIITNDEEKYLLRISSYETFNDKIRQFEYISKIRSKHALYPKALAIGLLSNNKVYMLLSYVEGDDLEAKIDEFDNIKQYELGVKAGLFLRDIHKIKRKKDKDFYQNYCTKIDNKINKFNSLSIDVKNKDLIINHIIKNKELLYNRNLTLNHGDYHIGNMVIDDKLNLGVIDYDKLKFNETLDDFKPFYFTVIHSSYFQSGLINGYFKNKIPKDFFKILSLYAAESLISHLPWSLKFGQKEVDVALDSINKVLEWYDDFKLEIPKWYLKKDEVYGDK